MKSVRHRSSRPVVVPAARAKPRTRRARVNELLGAEALDAPMPGSLLVLLSRLHRSQDGTPGTGDDSTR